MAQSVLVPVCPLPTPSSFSVRAENWAACTFATSLEAHHINHALFRLFSIGPLLMQWPKKNGRKVFSDFGYFRLVPAGCSDCEKDASSEEETKRDNNDVAQEEKKEQEEEEGKDDYCDRMETEDGIEDGYAADTERKGGG